MRLIDSGVAAAVATAATKIHCGPTAEEAGQAVLLVAPAVLLVTLGLQQLLLFLWRRRRTDLSLRWKRGAALVGVLAVPAILVAALAHDPLEWAPFAFWLFGCSYAALLLVSTRLCMLQRGPIDLVLAHAPPLILLIVPAVALTLGVNRVLDLGCPECLFVHPGGGGWIAGPLAAVVFLEAWLRTRKRGDRPPGGGTPSPH